MVAALSSRNLGLVAPASSLWAASWLWSCRAGGGIGSGLTELGGLFLLGWRWEMGSGAFLPWGKNTREWVPPPAGDWPGHCRRSWLSLGDVLLSLPQPLARDPSSSCPPRSPATSAHSLRALHLPSFLLWTELLPVPGTWWVLHQVVSLTLCPRRGISSSHVRVEELTP